MNCPKCKSDKYVKDGVVNQRQRYQCKQCNFRYTVKMKSTSKPQDIKRLALEMRKFKELMQHN